MKTIAEEYPTGITVTGEKYLPQMDQKPTILSFMQLLT